MIQRCTTCGSWFDLRRFPSCPVCGRPDIPMAMPAAKPRRHVGQPPINHAYMEASRDSTITAWTIPVGIVIGILGPFVVFRASGELQIEFFGALFAIVVVVALVGHDAKYKNEPARYVAGRVARSALLTILVAIAAGALVALVVVVLVFIACVGAVKGGGVF